MNARGGILGRQVQLVSYDDQSNPANVPSLYTKLIDVDKVDIVTSPYATAMIAPSMPVVMQRGMCYVSLFGAGVNEKLKYDRYFSMNVTGDDIKGTYARGFLECTKMLPTPPKTISILAVDNDFAQRAAESVRLLSKEYGLRVVYDRSYPPSTVDFTPTIRAIQAQRPDVVFFASYPPDSNGILRAVSELRFTAALFGGGMIGPQIAAVQAQLGPILNNLVTWDVYSPEPTMQLPRRGRVPGEVPRPRAAGTDRRARQLPAALCLCADAGGGTGADPRRQGRPGGADRRHAGQQVQHHRRRDRSSARSANGRRSATSSCSSRTSPMATWRSTRSPAPR